MTDEALKAFEAEIYAFVGREVCAPTPARDAVNPALIRQWTEIIGDANPAYTNDQWAASSARGKTIAPPAMMYVWGQEGYAVTTGRPSDAQADLVNLFNQHGYTGVLGTNVALGNIILSGHSGGYQVMSSIVDRGGLTSQVREVWLFDGLYAQSEKFLTWADQTGGRLLNIYTDGGGTKIRTEEMMATLKQRNKPLLATTDQAVTLPELTTNRLIFLHTDLSHSDVFAKRKTFQKFLETSCLPPRLEQPGEVSKLRPLPL